MKSIEKFKRLSTFTGEKVWELPLSEEFKNYLQSEYADIKNTPTNNVASTCSCACFLWEFAQDKHFTLIDNCNTLISNCNSGYLVKGISGNQTRNLIEFLISDN